MNSSKVALVGMAGRFPGARTVGEFWRNLRDGVESIRPLSEGELIANGVPAEVVARPDYVKAAAVLDDVDLFDAAFFGMSPKDAAIMDPQHRHFLECAWEAIEDAGHPPDCFSGSIGVFAGSGMNAYLIHNLLKNRHLMEDAGLFLIRQTGNDKDVLATRVSYQLDLRGPSLTVQTACSTSLVAVHLACQSLLSFECDMALAGGVTIEIPHAQGYVYREGEILSRDGHCRSFDAASSGTVFSSGVGIVVLRRLEDAIADHDTIHAVILGSAVNNDGLRKVGFLAPSVAGQAEVIAEALEVAGVDAESVSYVETHGTGTAVGDPIEIKALTQAFRQHTDRKGYCAIGSLKSNVGHLDTAAGVAGLIKTVLALRHRQLPASLHFRTANPQIDFRNSPFYVNRSLGDWHATGTHRRAGVTSLGIGGTNAHVVLEEAPDPAQPESSRTHHLIPLSAKTEQALDDMASRLAAHLREQPTLRLADVAFTCQVGRKEFRHRRALVAKDTAEAASKLSQPESRRDGPNDSPRNSPSSIVFLFSGQGTQHLDMGAELYASQPIFRDWLDRCASLLPPDLGQGLGALLSAGSKGPAAADTLNRTSIAQPALFALEYALAQWWMAHGIRPQAMLGHSLGEYVAACLADVFSLEDALAIIVTRGRLMEACPSGSMLAVSAPHDAFPLPESLSVAAVNAPDQCVVSGPEDAITHLEARLGEQGVACHRLQTSHAFHSAMMEPALAPFRDQLSRIALRPPRIPYLSNLTGTWITPEAATDPGYWAKHLRNTVRFSDCVAELRRPGRILIEVGPGRTLASLVRQQIAGGTPGNRVTVFSSLPRREETVPASAFLLNTLGQLWVRGQAVDWSASRQGETVTRIPLPTYPFQRQRFWIDPDKEIGPLGAGPLARSAAPEAPGSSRLEKAGTDQESIDQWFYERSWSPTARATTASLDSTCWLVFQDPLGLGKEIAHKLRGEGHEVVEITPGVAFNRQGRMRYTIRPGVRGDFQDLLAELLKEKTSPRRIVHLWSVRKESTEPLLEDTLNLSFYSLLFLAQALGDQDLSGIDMAVVSDRLYSVAGEPVVNPAAATSLGPALVIPKEFAEITCRSIDIDVSSQGMARLADQVIAEHAAPFCDPAVALRGQQRWTPSLRRADLRASSSVRRLRQRGVYLITGGLGDLGLVIAEDLARHFKARLVLVGRTPFPSARTWKDALEASDTPARVKGQIRKLIEIESLGAEVVLLSGNVCSREDMRRSLEFARARFGSIHGVIHAAGVLEDRPIQVKSRESASSVLDPKVRGTLVLSELLQESRAGGKSEPPLDFFALFSSVSSVLAPAGQVDYVAANAFLDAFAASRHDARVVAINWGPWQGVGMAARTTSVHPLLGRRLLNTAEEIIYSAPVNCERHWVLGDHRLKTGRALLPGTGYMEMALAALTEGAVDSGAIFENVFFLAPLLAGPGSEREARVELRRGRMGDYQFSVRAKDGGWTEHASGMIAKNEQAPPPDRDIDRIKARCRSRVLTFDDAHRTVQETFFDFGPRWRCLKAINFGDCEGLAELELASAFFQDTASYHLHPALLDLATGSALYLVENYGQSDAVYVPMSYRRVVVFRPLPAKFFSHIRSREGNEAGRDLATFDITLLDEKGRVLIEIEGFAMRWIRDPAHAFSTAATQDSAPSARNESVPEHVMRGIEPARGARAFAHIVSAEGPAGIFVLPDEPRTPAPAPAAAMSVRPAIEKDHSSDRVESVLSQWWQESLGVEQVGLDDDFFDLGGQSLIGVRLFSKIKKTYGIDLALSTLFEARTVQALAQLIRRAKTKTSTSTLSGGAIIRIQPKGTRLPLYVISGIGGKVIVYQGLAAKLGEDQPVYGLTPRGPDGGELHHRSVEEMAAYYVEAIRELQPEGPYRLLGYSFGGTVAFEMAQQLVAQGASVGFLGMLDTIERHYRKQVWKSFGFRDRISVYRSEFKEALLEGAPLKPLWLRFKLRYSRMVSPFIHATSEWIPQFGQSIEDTHQFASANYQPKVYPGTVTLFRCSSKGVLDGENDHLGWDGLAAGGIEIHHVPSAHHTILREPGVKSLAEKLRECLDREPALATARRQPEPAFGYRD
jgi:acyl transferase domain-containing protein/thioesterase domain-containing protein